jgi:uncharacterized membrane protein YccC
MAADSLHLDDLVWAAFSGYMVTRAGVAQTVPRGINRIIGTAAGAIAGLLLAPAAAESPSLLCAGLFIAAFVGNFGALTSPFSYAWIFFGLTTGLVLTQAFSVPEDIVQFAETRLAEVATGTLACFVVASLFEMGGRSAAPVTMPATGGPWRIFDEGWLREHWSVLAHSMRTALAVAALPWAWRWFGISDFNQTAITSYVVMIVPSVIVRERRNYMIYERMAHRTLGCLTGSFVAVAGLHFAVDSLWAQLMVLVSGIWVGYQIQSGREGVSYFGTQFTLGLLITLVQGPAPAVSVIPGLERLLGVAIGSTMLVLLILIWPLPRDDL